MADRELTGIEQIQEEGRRAKEEHAAKHGDDSPTSAAATAEECAALGKALGFGTYAADESVAVEDQPATRAKARRPAEDKAAAGPAESKKS